jgi:hypothetical protein
VRSLHSTLIIASLVCAAACTEGGQNAAPISTAAPAASSENVAEVLTKIENDWIEAALKHDAATVERILADEFVAIGPSGKTSTKAQIVDLTKPGGYTAEALSINNVNVRVFGDAAVVTYTQSEKSQNQGRDLSGRSVWTDVFVKRNGRWQIVAEHASCAEGGCGRG